MPTWTVEQWAFIAVGVAVLILVLGAGLIGPLRRFPSVTRTIEDLPQGTFPILMLAGLTWLALFVLTTGAAFWGAYRIFGDQPAVGGSAGSLGIGALLIGLLGAPFLIWNTVIKQRALGFQKEGHITDRISKAVEQLGAEKTVKRPLLDADGTPRVDGDGKPMVAEQTVPNIEVRIGGILSLERIAQDSCAYDHGRDHVRVMEILCAYVRENAPASGAKDHPYGEWELLKDDATEEERKAHLVKQIDKFGNEKSHRWLIREWIGTLPKPREDVALSLKVIGRRDATQLRVEARWGKDALQESEWSYGNALPIWHERIDWDVSSDLADAEFSKFCLLFEQWGEQIDDFRGYRLDLRNTNLQKNDLSKLMLGGAFLRGSRMEGANLFKTNFVGANLEEARLDWTNATSARLEKARLELARLDGADLLEANLTSADLFDASLVGACLDRAELDYATFANARADNASFREASFWNTQFHGASLKSSSFEDAHGFFSTNFTDANLGGSEVRDVFLGLTNISSKQVASMFGDASVELPGDVVPGHADWPTHWPLWKLDWKDFRIERDKWRADSAAYTPPPPPG